MVVSLDFAIIRFFPYFLSACPKRRQEMIKHRQVRQAAAGIHGISFISAEERFAASFPYSDVIT